MGFRTSRVGHFRSAARHGEDNGDCHNAIPGREVRALRPGSSTRSRGPKTRVGRVSMSAIDQRHDLTHFVHGLPCDHPRRLATPDDDLGHLFGLSFEFVGPRLDRF